MANTKVPDLLETLHEIAENKRAVLVYQAGIANVFEVVDFITVGRTGRNAHRLLQGDFRTCEAFARGMQVAGYVVRSMHCNQAGDIVDATWLIDLDDAPFAENMHPVQPRTA